VTYALDEERDACLRSETRALRDNICIPPGRAQRGTQIALS